MHELSLASEVIKIAGYEAERNNAGRITGITIEAGNFCGVEIETFKSALELLTEGTILAGASLNIVHIRARGYCPSCNNEFEMDSRIDTCPVCNSFPSEIRGGHEFRVVSLTAEDD